MRKFGRLLALFCGIAVFGTAVFASENKPENLLEMDGDLYPKDQFPENCSDFLLGGKCDAKPIGFMHLESKKDGDAVYSKTTFSDAEKLQVTESSWEVDGHVKRVSIENAILQKVFELEVKDGKVFYKITDKTNGKVKTSDEDAEDNLVVPSTIMRYIGGKLGDLAAGKEIKIKVAAIDRQEAFTFNLKKTRMEKKSNGDSILVLELKANSIFVRSVVDPMYLYITQDGELSGFEGKSPLMRKVTRKDGDQYKDMIVKASYRYGVDQLKPKLPFEINPPTCTDEMNKAGMTKCEIPTVAPSVSNSSSQ